MELQWKLNKNGIAFAIAIGTAVGIAVEIGLRIVNGIAIGIGVEIWIRIVRNYCRFLRFCAFFTFSRFFQNLIFFFISFLPSIVINFQFRFSKFFFSFVETKKFRSRNWFFKNFLIKNRFLKNFRIKNWSKKNSGGIFFKNLISVFLKEEK